MNTVGSPCGEARTELEKDALTGLLTKESFYTRAEEVLRENPEKEYRFLCTDIENFKMINVKYGTETGDAALKYVANCLMESVPGFVVGGRISGDGFAILREAVPLGDRELLYYRLRDMGPVPKLIVKFGAMNVSRSMSVQLMYNSTLMAMQDIKGKYGEWIAEYDDSLRERLLTRQNLLDSMDEAMNDQQFQVYYQPKHHLPTNRTAGAEALVRWIHPDLGLLKPGTFIPLFEQNGFIKKLDSYVFRQICQDIAQWKQSGMRSVPISVNFSRRDFEISDLVANTAAIADEYGIDHSLIHIEITESAYADNPKYIFEVIRQFHDLGFVIELDDFGTGYSSLTMLNSLYLDIIKLDMSIIREDVPGSKRNILDFCMQLAKQMDLETVAEGVETKQQLERLQKLGCDYVQGYYFGEPMPAESFERYIRAEDGQSPMKEVPE